MKITTILSETISLDLVRGETVKLTCIIPLGHDCSQIIWIRTPSSGLPEHTDYISHCDVLYSDFSASASRGKISVSKQGIDVILTINNIELEDTEFIYTCQDNNYRILETFKLSLHVPKCSSSLHTSLTSSEIKAILNCSINTMTILKWYSPAGVLLSSNIEADHKAISTEVILTKKHNYERFRCSAGYDPSVRHNWCDVTPLQVRPSVYITPLISYANTGDNVTFSCIPTIEFPDLTYKWLVNQKSIPNDQQNKYIEYRNQLTILNVTLLDGGTVLKCKAHNAFGVKTGSRKAIVYVNDQMETTTVSCFISESNGLDKYRCLW